MTQLRFLTALSLASAPESTGASEADAAYELVTGWMQKCLDLSRHDDTEGYTALTTSMSAEERQSFLNATPQEKQDASFLLRLRDVGALREYAGPIVSRYGLDLDKVMQKAQMYVSKVSGRGPCV